MAVPSKTYDASSPEPVLALGHNLSTKCPNVGGTSGRLQDFRGGDPFKPISEVHMQRSIVPDNVTDSSTRARHS